MVACVAGETQGGEGTHFLMESGLRTDMAVVAEPFGADNLVTVHAGIVHMAIHTYGITGHIGRLEGTVNAVHKMTRIINALQQVEFRYTPRADCPSSRDSTSAASSAGAARSMSWSNRRTSRICALSSSMSTSSRG